MKRSLAALLISSICLQGHLTMADEALNSGTGTAEVRELMGVEPGLDFTYSLIPNGIWDHNKAFAAEWVFETGIDPVSRGEIGKVIIEEELGRDLRIWGFPNPRRFMAGIMVPATSGIAARSFSMAIVAEMARVSCALELYQEREGSYPDSLSALVPDLLAGVPKDRFSPEEKPIQYRREGDRYLLYSVGQNRTDEGGAVVFRNSSRKRIDRDEGDLVWGFTDFEDLPEGE